MTGNDILKKLTPYFPGNRLRLERDNQLGSARLTAWLQNYFSGSLQAIVEAPQVGADNVVFAAQLQAAGFLLYQKATSLTATLTFTAGSDGLLDGSAAVQMPAGYQFGQSFITLAALPNNPLDALALNGAVYAVASTSNDVSALFAAKLQCAQGLTSELDWLLGEQLALSGSVRFTTQSGTAYPVLSLQSATLRTTAIGGFELDATLVAGTVFNPRPVVGSNNLFARVSLLTALVTPQLTLPVEMPLQQVGQKQFLLNLDPRQPLPSLGSLDHLASFTGGKSPGASLSADTPLGALSLDSMCLEFDAVSRHFSNLQIVVGLGKDWTIIDERLKLLRLQAVINVPVLVKNASDENYTFSVAVKAALQVGATEVDALIMYPEEIVGLELGPGSVIDLNDFITNLAKGATLPGAGDLKITELSAQADIKQKTYSLECAATGNLSIIPTFQLDGLNLSVVYANGGLSEFLFGAVFTLTKAKATLYISASRELGVGWVLSGGTFPDQAINLTNLVEDIASVFGVQLPATELPHIELNALAMNYQTRDSSFTFEAAASFKSADDPVPTKIEGDLKLNYDGTTKNWTGVVSGSIVLNQTNQFTVTYDFRANSVVSLSWEATGSETIGIDDLCKVFGSPDMQQMIPKDLDLVLIAVKGKYDITTQTVVFECESKRWGKADIAVWNDKTTGWNIFFGVDINVAISLTNIPLIGKALISAVGTVSLDEIQAAVSRPNLTHEQAKKLAGEIDTGYPTPPDTGLPSGAALVMIFDAGGNKSRISIGTPDSRGVPRLPLLLPGRKIPGPPGEALVAAASDGAIWFALQKSFGPVTIDKVGVRYSGGKLWALMNASVAAGSLVIAAEGLGVGSPLSTFTPSFTVDGIVVSLKAGPVAFSGALVGKIDPVDLYGEFSLVFAKFSIGAIAGYADYQHHPSFFLFGVLNATLGGPPFFFVTGLAAGFGLNRSLLVPDVSGVDQFPLVEWAQGINKPNASGGIGDQVQKAMEKLETSGVIAPNIGEYWLAAGISFTSFEMVDSFALAIVKFGNQLELDLLGLCTMAVSPAPSKPVAEVQLALKATIQPAIGLIGISGQLTSNSYVLSKQAKLTGGFAYYMWVGGEHAGEFVLSLGGYSPKYQVPDYYPKVPRLGLAWKQDCLSITGELYFALTSSAVMAGGSLSAVWQSDDIRAWFDVQADFLILFTPFHYYVYASIDLGASVRINLKFTIFTLSIHLGVSIELWGPEFSGKVHVDLTIVSFTIALGAEPTPVKNSISWNDFVAQLLPSEHKVSATNRRRRPSLMAAKRMRLAANAPAPPPAVLQIVGLEGILQTLSTEEGTLNWLVDGQTFQAQVQTVIPLRTYSLQGPGVVLAPPPEQPPGPPNFDFGCSPAGIASGGLHSNLEVSLTSAKAAVLDAVMVLGSVSKALWNKPPNFDDHGTPTDVDPVNDTTIKNVLTGFTLIPTVQKPDRTKLPIPLRYLKYQLDPNKESFTWSAPVVQTTDPFLASDTVPSTIAAARATANRPRLLAAILRAKLEVDQTPDVSTLASKDSNYLLSSPLLRYLGEVKG